MIFRENLVCNTGIEVVYHNCIDTQLLEQMDKRYIYLYLLVSMEIEKVWYSQASNYQCDTHYIQALETLCFEMKFSTLINLHYDFY